MDIPHCNCRLQTHPPPSTSPTSDHSNQIMTANSQQVHSRNREGKNTSWIDSKSVSQGFKYVVSWKGYGPEDDEWIAGCDLEANKRWTTTAFRSFVIPVRPCLRYALSDRVLTRTRTDLLYQEVPLFPFYSSLTVHKFRVKGSLQAYLMVLWWLSKILATIHVVLA